MESQMRRSALLAPLIPRHHVIFDLCSRFYYATPTAMVPFIYAPPIACGTNFN